MNRVRRDVSDFVCEPPRRRKDGTSSLAVLMRAPVNQPRPDEVAYLTPLQNLFSREVRSYEAFDAPTHRLNVT